MSELPSGWASCQLTDVGQIVTGKTPSTKEQQFYGGNIPFIKPGDLNHSGLIFNTETFLTEAGAAEVPSLPPQSIIVTCIGILGKVGLTTTSSATNQQINAVIPEAGINPNFLFHYCKTLKPWLENESSATTIAIVNKGIFSTAPVPLAPLAEQTRIAQKLDELLAQVDTLKVRLDAIPALLKRFRQSVLAAAVSGRLTEEWRNQQKSRTNEASPTTGVDSDNILEAKAHPNLRANIWTKGSLSAFVEIDIGHAFKSGEFTDSGIRLLRGQNIEPGALRWSETKFYPEEKISGLEKLYITEGDIILAMDRPIVSAGLKLARAKKEDLPCVLVQRVSRFTNFKDLLPDYLMLLLSDLSFQNYLLPNQTGSDIPHISGKQILSYPIKVPGLEEQTEIVHRVEQLFAFTDQLEAKIKTAQARVNHLTQSILAKAFRGELVPQDPNDEPASELLTRIQAQRAAAPKAKRGRKVSA